MDFNFEETPEEEKLCLLQTNAKRTRTASPLAPKKEKITLKENVLQGVSQRKAALMNQTGCQKGDWFNTYNLKGKSSSISNSWQTSWCGRTELIFNDLQQLMDEQHATCGWTLAPKTVLAFGCSIGIECVEASGRFPEALVYGYDIDSDVIEKATKEHGSSYIKFVSNITDLPVHAFDLITVNNVLFDKMEPHDFSILLQQLDGLLNPSNGILELMIYDKSYKGPGYSFDSEVAWQGIDKHVSASTCSQATTPSLNSTLFVFRSSPENPLMTGS